MKAAKTGRARPRARKRPALRNSRRGSADQHPISPWISTLGSFADSALRIAGLGRETILERTPEQLRMMAIAGESLRDVRKVAGLTVTDIVKALDLRDKTVWEAVEDGREALSMELILRLASLLARNDPLPFVLRMARSYQPRLWGMLVELGVDGLPLQLERERDFINIFRRHDAARALPDAQWAKLLAFTRQAFELGLGMMETGHRAAAPEPATPRRTSRRKRRKS